MQFEILPSTNRQWYWRIVASNGQILAHSETYTSAQSCRDAIAVVKAGAASAPIRERATR